MSSENKKTSSTPTFSEYCPKPIPYQARLVKDVLTQFDYSLGTHEVVLTGSVGSGKSLPAAHLGVKHCIDYPGARLLLGRKALPDLKDTIFKKILEHLDDQDIKEGIHYFVNETRAQIRFRNGSDIISRSWSDRKYKKLGSIEVSAAIIEELAENDEEDEAAYEFIKMRVGRLPHVPQNWIISCTNPDSPGHWAYKRLLQSKNPLVHVYYSLLSDNPFLPDSYMESLLEGMDPKLARRMIYGEWVDIQGEVLYHQYSKEHNFRDYSYKVIPNVPVRVSWDFNIGEGKPLSVSVAQIIGDEVHFFNEIVLDGIRTEDSCHELSAKGLLDFPCPYIINGDSTGKSRDTRSKFSDYDIINKFMANYQTRNGRTLRYEMCVPASNPAIRTRHNDMNAYFCNANGRRRAFVYKDAPTHDEGFRLTKLKKNGSYIEDDSKRYQHVTTSAGYMLNWYVQDKDAGGVEFLDR